MLVGAGIFAEVYPSLKDSFLKWGDYGRLSIPALLGINHWIVIALVWGGMVSIFIVLEKKKL
jgi:hypothetical protein